MAAIAANPATHAKQPRTQDRAPQGQARPPRHEHPCSRPAATAAAATCGSAQCDATRADPKPAAPPPQQSNDRPPSRNGCEADPPRRHNKPRTAAPERTPRTHQSPAPVNLPRTPEPQPLAGTCIAACIPQPHRHRARTSAQCPDSESDMKSSSTRSGEPGRAHG